MFKFDERFEAMNEDQRRKLFEEMLKEAMDDIYDSPAAEPRKKPAIPCGCVHNCGDISKHDENTVLEGIILDEDDRTFESSVLQDSIQFARRAGSQNL